MVFKGFYYVLERKVVFPFYPLFYITYYNILTYINILWLNINNKSMVYYLQYNKFITEV